MGPFGGFKWSTRASRVWGIYAVITRLLWSFLCRLFARPLFRSYFACLFCPGEVGVVSFYYAACRHCVIEIGPFIKIAVIACVTFPGAAILLLQNFWWYNFFFQVVVASKAWMVLPLAIRPDFNSLFKCLLSSRADSTVQKYLKEINKFLLWCSNCATVAIFFFCCHPLSIWLRSTA